jgi:nucleoside 2-deoxyribosyltransferase
MRIFLSGIISGSLLGKELHDQSYRQELRQLLRRVAPQAQVLCPWDMHPDAVEYGPERARAAFLAEVEAAASSDLVVAYIPQASMGTAIEMWEASRRGVPVLAISPLTTNWTLLLLARRIFPTMGDFAAFAEAGGLKEYLRR